MNWFLIYIHHIRATGARSFAQFIDTFDCIDVVDFMYYVKYRGKKYPYGDRN